MEIKTTIDSFLPLTEATFFILLSLSPGPTHGYAIMKSVEQMSAGRVTFSTGTLYGAIRRLLDQGWIVRKGEDEENGKEQSRSRKDYELTSLGRSILIADISRMETLVKLSASYTKKEV